MYSSIRSFVYADGTFSPQATELILEAPLEIIVNNVTYSLIMFTPGMTRELVTGFLFTEGLIDSFQDMGECLILPTNRGQGDDVIVARASIPMKDLMLAGIKGKRVSYSSCGICGKENYYEMKKLVKRVGSRQRFLLKVIQSVPDRLPQHQPLYERTGGAHAALLLDPEGNGIVSSEDMGRHNALDKVIGAALMRGIPFHDKMLLSTGRASIEMILKTARAGVPLFIAMSRPTIKAVEAAKFYNITLMDMAKGTHRIYSHIRRIQGV